MVSGEVAIPDCTSPESPEFAGEALDRVSLAIDVAGHRSLQPTILLGDMGTGAKHMSALDQSRRFRTAVAAHEAGPGQFFLIRFASAPLAPARPYGRPCSSIMPSCLMLNAPKSRALVFSGPLFPPAACWWACMIELSFNAMDSGNCSTRDLKRLIQTPAFSNRFMRLRCMVCEPDRLGKSLTGQTVRRM